MVIYLLLYKHDAYAIVYLYIILCLAESIEKGRLP